MIVRLPFPICLGFEKTNSMIMSCSRSCLKASELNPSYIAVTVVSTHPNTLKVVVRWLKVHVFGGFVAVWFTIAFLHHKFENKTCKRNPQKYKNDQSGCPWSYS